MALTAGLAVATFVKAFGVGFLARPRSDAAAHGTGEPADDARRDGAGRGWPASGWRWRPRCVLPVLGRVAGGITGIGPAGRRDA